MSHKSHGALEGIKQGLCSCFNCKHPATRVCDYCARALCSACVSTDTCLDIVEKQNAKRPELQEVVRLDGKRLWCVFCDDPKEHAVMRCLDCEVPMCGKCGTNNGRCEKCSAVPVYPCSNCGNTTAKICAYCEEALCVDCRPDRDIDRCYACTHEEDESSAVNHPSHYNMGTIEVITVIEDWNLTYNAGTALKYIGRHPHKGKPVEDLEKAIWCLKREIERLKGENSD